MSRLSFLACGALLLVVTLTAPWGCGPGTNNNNSDGGNTERSNTEQPPAQATIKRKWTYRLIAGVSMGGAMSSIIGTRNPEKFDIIGTLGAPNDFTYLLSYIKKSMLGGFCDLKQLEKFKADGKLNTKAAYCESSAPKAQYPFEYSSHYNNWHYDDAGGNWNRPKLVQVLQDLMLAFGNPGFQNPNSTYWPHPQIPNSRRETKDRCNNPIRIKGVKHDLYNPEGKYDLITYCDGNVKRDGIYNPDKPNEHKEPVEFALAVDINGNGKRDYGEPVIATTSERYEDTGSDGCKDDREDGKGGCVAKGQKGVGGKDPNKDNYHPIDNPLGTEGNDLHDEKEPYQDTGLDGIADTKDYGEGDGKFTTTAGWKNFMAHSPRNILRKLTRAQLDRLNIYIDAGIRDLFNFHIGSLHVFGSLKSQYMEEPKRVRLYDRFISLSKPGTKEFDYAEVDWSDKGQHVYIRYGDPKASANQIALGDGDHVNGGRIIDRVFAFFSYATHHLPKPDLKFVGSNGKGEGVPQHFVYASKALGRKNIYTVVLPPGYNKNKDVRYPVVYFGHGYGMSGPDMSTVLSLIALPMRQGVVAKMIMVSLHGSCEQMLPDPNNKGKFIEKRLDQCKRGTFYVNGQGIKNNGPKMEDAFFEVVSEVEKRYGNRIRKPETLDYPIPVR